MKPKFEIGQNVIVMDVPTRPIGKIIKIDMTHSTPDNQVILYLIHCDRWRDDCHIVEGNLRLYKE
jgi:hypothetical protein